MKYTAVAVAVLAFFSSAVIASPDSVSRAHQAEREAFEQRYTIIDAGVALLDTVRSATLSSYGKNTAWPVNTGSLVGQGYITTVQAPWGANVTGLANATGNSYTLALSSPDVEIAQAIASKLGGIVAGKTVQINVPVPALAAVNQNSLSRVAVPGSPEMNRMYTDIDMANNNLNNVNQLTATILNAGESTVGSMTILTALDVQPDATFRKNVNVVGKVQSAEVVTGTLQVTGGAEMAGPLNILGDASATNFTARQNIIAAEQVRGKSALFNGAVVADSFDGRTGDFDSLVSRSHTTGSLITQGNAEFWKDALFKGSVTINGALTVGGIASAMDIREGGVLLKDKYSQLAGNNVFSGANTFNQSVALNGGATVDGKQVISADGNTLYEGGVALKDKYSQLAGNNRFTGSNTFTQAINADGGLSVDGRTVISADGNTLYEGGVALNQKYLGINATAKNSDKLGNVVASNYARTDIEETFGRKVNFSQGLHVLGDWVRVNGQNGVYFQSYGGGWHMTDSSWIRAYGGKSIYTSGMVQADGGIKIDGKWIASADGNTLYEANQRLADRYLGRNATAYNSDRLGNVAASQFARRDTANTFAQRQTFNGGISTGGTSSIGSVTFTGSVTLNNDLAFRNSRGQSKSLRGMSDSVDSLNAWKSACQRNAKDPMCGLDLGQDTGGGGGQKTVWTGSANKLNNSWGTGTYLIHTTAYYGSDNRSATMLIKMGSKSQSPILDMWQGTQCSMLLKFTGSTWEFNYNSDSRCSTSRARITQVDKIS